MAWGEKGVLVSQCPGQWQWAAAGVGCGRLQEWGVPRADAAVDTMGGGVSDGQREAWRCINYCYTFVIS